MMVCSCLAKTPSGREWGRIIGLRLSFEGDIQCSNSSSDDGEVATDASNGMRNRRGTVVEIESVKAPHIHKDQQSWAVTL
jgi:hypothetical protein